MERIPRASSYLYFAGNTSPIHDFLTQLAQVAQAAALRGLKQKVKNLPPGA